MPAAKMRPIFSAKTGLPMLTRHLLAELKAEHDQLIERIDRCEAQLKAWHADPAVSQRLATGKMQ